jgi:hypothetical protein
MVGKVPDLVEEDILLTSLYVGFLLSSPSAYPPIRTIYVFSI